MERVYFVTNRKPNRKRNPTDFGTEFNAHGIGNLRYGYADFANNTRDSYELYVAHERWQPDFKSGDTAPGARLGSRKIMEAVRQEMADRNLDILIFIHGYNTSFQEALTAGARLQSNLQNYRQDRGLDLAVFSWPSDGSAMPYLAYGSDRQEARASGPAFARAFLKLTDFLREATSEEECNQNIHLLVHSMGNYLLRHAVAEIQQYCPGRLPRIFDQVLLVAADEDNDTFEHDRGLRMLPHIARRVNIYFNRNDLALEASDKTKPNPDRLGTDGPRLPHQLPAKVVQLDCTPVVDGAVEHSYHIDSELVTQDMLATLAGIEADQVPGRQYIPDSNRYRLTN